MPHFELTQALESRMMNAWPSFECQFYDGWVVRFANGYTKRANSVSPLWAGASLDDELIKHIVSQFAQMNLRPVFRLTGLESPGTDERLADHGFVESDPTFCMINDDPGSFDAEESINISSELPERWVSDTIKSYGEHGVGPEVLAEIVSRIRQTHGFATLMMDDQAVAWGLGVIERGYIGLYDIVVLPDLRGLGLGRRVLNGLISWGIEHNAKRVYLQVTEQNEVARSLYRSLGFADAYRYRHRILATATVLEPELEETVDPVLIAG